MSFWLHHDVDAALEDFNHALAGASDKQLMKARFYRGQVLSSAGKLDDAIADFNAAIESRSDFAPAYWMRAKTHFLLGKVPDGLADTKEYVRLTTSAADDAATGSKRFRLGKTLRLMGQQLQNEPRKRVLERSAKELQAAIDAGPHTGEAWQTFGAVQELLGRDAEAVQTYTRGFADVPNDLQLCRMRGWIHANRGEYDLAQIDFTEAIRIAARDAEAHAGLGFVWAEQGRTEGAQREATTALLADADNHLALHWVACIFGRLSAADPKRQIEREDLAIAALNRAIALSRRNPLGQDGDEVLLIQSEKSFPESLRRRPEFRGLKETHLESRE